MFRISMAAAIILCLTLFTTNGHAQSGHFWLRFNLGPGCGNMSAANGEDVTVSGVAGVGGLPLGAFISDRVVGSFVKAEAWNRMPLGRSGPTGDQMKTGRLPKEPPWAAFGFDFDPSATMTPE